MAGRALHPDGRILANHRLSEGSARRAAWLLCGILGYPPSVRCYYQKVTSVPLPHGRTDPRVVDQICEPLLWPNLRPTPCRAILLIAKWCNYSNQALLRPGAKFGWHSAA